MRRFQRFRDNLRLSTRFALMVGTIVCAFCLGSAFLLYAHLKEKVILDTYQKGQIVFALMDGIGAYVNDTLRPRMFEVMSSLPGDEFFVAEAMSTTRIRHGVMGSVAEKKPEFLYRRVSPAPRNPANHLDPIHVQRIGEFKTPGQHSEWHGIWFQNRTPYFSIVKPVYVKGECLKCHGNPENAPSGLIKLYGAERGFGYREGDLMGLESISIPLSGALEEIHQIAVHVFAIGLCTMFCLFLAIEGAFLKLVGQPLKYLATRFEDIVNGARPLGEEVPIQTMDEIGELTSSFNTMGRYLAEAQETLETNAEVLQSIIDGISDPLALVNADGSLSVLNQAYQGWIALSSPAVLGQKNGQENPVEGSSSPEAMLHLAFTTARTVNGEWSGPDGHHYLISFYPILNDDGQVTQVVQYMRDVTLAKRAENQMMQMEKMAAIGQLSAGVAHEINNPLGIILCYTKLLQRDLPDDDPVVQDVKVIDRQARACKDIVDGLLSFARHGATRKEKGALNDGLINMAAMVEKQFEKDGIKLVLQLDPDMPEFSFDPKRMEQVYMNLLMNAKQAIPKGGTVNIRTSYHAEQRMAEIRIQDSGTGIEPKYLDHIFNPFFTTKQTGEGTGLGLSVSYGIVKEHDGKITVETAPNAGSTFIITLPLESLDGQLN
jgi:two-component system, NtrC family, sensor kinase